MYGKQKKQSQKIFQKLEPQDIWKAALGQVKKLNPMLLLQARTSLKHSKTANLASAGATQSFSRKQLTFRPSEFPPDKFNQTCQAYRKISLYKYESTDWKKEDPKNLKLKLMPNIK